MLKFSEVPSSIVYSVLAFIGLIVAVQNAFIAFNGVFCTFQSTTFSTKLSPTYVGRIFSYFGGAGGQTHWSVELNTLCNDDSFYPPEGCLRRTNSAGFTVISCSSNESFEKSIYRMGVECYCETAAKGSIYAMDISFTNTSLSTTIRSINLGDNVYNCDIEEERKICTLNSVFYTYFLSSSLGLIMLSSLFRIMTIVFPCDFTSPSYNSKSKFGKYLHYFTFYYTGRWLREKNLISFCNWFQNKPIILNEGDIFYSFNDSEDTDFDFIQGNYKSNREDSVVCAWRIGETTFYRIDTKNEINSSSVELTNFEHSKFIFCIKKAAEGFPIVNEGRAHMLSVSEIINHIKKGKKLKCEICSKSTEFYGERFPDFLKMVESKCEVLKQRPDILKKLLIHFNEFFGYFDAKGFVKAINCGIIAPTGFKNCQWKIYISDVFYHILKENPKYKIRKFRSSRTLNELNVFNKEFKSKTPLGVEDMEKLITESEIEVIGENNVDLKPDDETKEVVSEETEAVFSLKDIKESKFRTSMESTYFEWGVVKSHVDEIKNSNNGIAGFSSSRVRELILNSQLSMMSRIDLNFKTIKLDEMPERFKLGIQLERDSVEKCGDIYHSMRICFFEDCVVVEEKIKEMTEGELYKENNTRKALEIISSGISASKIKSKLKGIKTYKKGYENEFENIILNFNEKTLGMNIPSDDEIVRFSACGEGRILIPAYKCEEDSIKTSGLKSNKGNLKSISQIIKNSVNSSMVKNTLLNKINEIENSNLELLKKYSTLNLINKILKIDNGTETAFTSMLLGSVGKGISVNKMVFYRSDNPFKKFSFKSMKFTKKNRDELKKEIITKEKAQSSSAVKSRERNENESGSETFLCKCRIFRGKKEIPERHINIAVRQMMEYKRSGLKTLKDVRDFYRNEIIRIKDRNEENRINYEKIMGMKEFAECFKKFNEKSYYVFN